ncbi:MAG TPA: thioredoxin family protein [Actinomycetota bacterium]|nr:thioredoxin family protein [Actinomycetota bacterium]
MIERLAIAAAVFAAVAVAYWLWKRPPRRLGRSDLAPLGIREPAIVQFSTADCAPCRKAEPRLREAATRSEVPYRRIDVDDRPDVAREYGIRTVPTIVVTGRGGRVMEVWTSLPENGEIAEAARRARIATARPRA